MASEMSTDERPCKGCEYKGKAATAVKLCETCDNLCLCSVCAGLHGDNKATKGHILTPFRFKEDRTRDGTCSTHGMQIQCFCCSCSLQCCHLCILFDHGDHIAGTVSEVLALLMEEVKCIKESRDWQANEVKEFAKDLLLIKATNAKGQEVLFSEIEDHAKKCIEKINVEKEALKDRVREHFEISEGVTESLEKCPELAARLEASYSRADQLLQNAEPHPFDIEELMKVKDEMEEASKQFGKVVKDEYWQSFNQLWQNIREFVPKCVNENEEVMGRLGYPSQKLHNCDVIFEKELEVDNSEEKYFIPFVTALGNDLYAVAHPTVEGQFSKGVDIYRYPGELVQTITDHIHPLHDMASTSDGKLAVLSEGTAEGSSAVRLFDPMTGYISATNDLPIQGPMSFDTNLRRQYVILSEVVSKDEERKDDDSDDEGEAEEAVRMVTVINEDGSVHITQEIDEEYDVANAHKVSCSAKYIYIIGWKRFAVFQQKGYKLVRVTTCNTDYVLSDISVSDFNYITFSHIHRGGSWMLDRFKLNGEENIESYGRFYIGEYRSGSSISRVSLNDKYIVSSCGHKIRLFKEY